MLIENYKAVSFTPKCLGFLVMPDFSLIAYAAAIDTLRLANQLAEKELYIWETITLDNELVKASSGLEIKPDGKFEDSTFKDTANNTAYDMLFVCGGERISATWSKQLGQYLRQQDKKSVVLGALCTGGYLLAKAGLLEGYRFTLHWENIASTREEFQHLQVTDDIYEIDRDRYTCAGGTTPIDMFHHIISRQHGRELAAAISETIMIDNVRSMSERQRIPLRQQIGTSQPKLTEAVMLMESNLEEIMTSSELAQLVNISKRQLERLFRSYLNCTPSRYYLDLRLRNARRLLLQTQKNITDISIICGFTSAAHFSKCYKDMFGLRPREDRSSKYG